MLSCLLSTSAQDYSLTSGGVTTEVTFYSPQIVRVTKYQVADALGKSDPKVVNASAGDVMHTNPDTAAVAAALGLFALPAFFLTNRPNSRRS